MRGFRGAVLNSRHFLQFHVLFKLMRVCAFSTNHSLTWLNLARFSYPILRNFSYPNYKRNTSSLRRLPPHLAASKGRNGGVSPLASAKFIPQGKKYTWSNIADKIARIRKDLSDLSKPILFLKTPTIFRQTFLYIGCVFRSHPFLVATST